MQPSLILSGKALRHFVFTESSHTRKTTAELAKPCHFLAFQYQQTLTHASVVDRRAPVLEDAYIAAGNWR